MPRRKTFKTNIYPYHLRNRTQDKVFYSVPLDEVWKIYIDALRTISWAFGAQIHAFVLMSNHYHLLMSTPDQNVDDIARYMQSEVSRNICKRTGSTFSCFDTRYRWSVICDRDHYCKVYRYIYQNPLRAGICNKVSMYPYSTFHGRVGYSKLEVPLQNHPYLDSNDFESLCQEEDWLNLVMKTDEAESVRRGLRRFVFFPPKRLQFERVGSEKVPDACEKVAGGV